MIVKEKISPTNVDRSAGSRKRRRLLCIRAPNSVQKRSSLNDAAAFFEQTANGNRARKMANNTEIISV